VIGMNLSIYSSFLPLDDPEEAIAFYRDVLGFEVRLDVGKGAMRWITVGPADQPDTSVVLWPPNANPGATDDEKKTIAEMMAKGTFGTLLLASKDVDASFAEIAGKDAEVVQEPTDQPYGVRDCAFRDPAGNMIRIQQRN
jgi:catechol 2,3-dioxygenase-like lactoylglutathione lyase family enzyme